jgi:hypothetical protein
MKAFLIGAFILGPIFMIFYGSPASGGGDATFLGYCMMEVLGMITGVVALVVRVLGSG